MAGWWRWRIGTAVLLFAYSVFLLANLLGPAAVPNGSVSWLFEVAQALGAPEAVLTPHRFEFIVNALVFVPVSMLGCLLWSATTWRDWTAYGFAASAGVELMQKFVLPAGRVAQFDDVVSNTLGTLLGAATIVLVRCVVVGCRA